MRIVNQHLNYPRATLIEPNTKGYIHAAFEVDDSLLPICFSMSRMKRKLLERAKDFAGQLHSREEVTAANVFRAVVRPPLKQPYLESVRDRFHVARYDVALLIETRSPETARSLHAHKDFQDFMTAAETGVRYRHVFVGRNTRRIQEIDKTRPGVFLFNYFYAENARELLPVWEYTAGWFTSETNLDNSTLLMPLEGEPSEYGVINHCRWDSLPRLMPSLIFKPSMQRYVMENFTANKIAPMPILYRLA